MLTDKALPEGQRGSLPRAIVDRVRELEAASRVGGRPIATGWGAVDRELPAGGLPRGCLHEWLGEDAPPLHVLAHLALRAAGDGGWVCWVGQAVWVYGHALSRAGLLGRSLLLDPPPGPARVWAMDCALRCPGMVVVGDGAGLDMAQTRRLQLAAEAGGAVALIARPARDASTLSAAMTRWRVARAIGPDGAARWTVRLLRCKGAASLSDRVFMLERTEDAGVVALPALVAGGPVASAAGA